MRRYTVGQQRVPVSRMKNQTERTKNMEQYYIIRTKSAGVFFGNIKERNGSEVTLTNVRRIWYWEGACSLSQLAVDGTKKPNGCKFTLTVPEMTVLGVIEIIPCSETATNIIKGVAEWKI